MKAIIFGVTGQDGSHLLDILLEKNYTVIGVIRRSSVGNTKNIKHQLDNINFLTVPGDVTDTFSISKILKDHGDADEIYNLSAQSDVGESFKQPALTWDVTGKGCLNILQSMVDLNVKARFYQASSSEMFGAAYDSVHRTVDPYNTFGIIEEKFQNENTRFLPQSPYAIAKCAAHYITRLFREAYQVHASCGILFNHCGPRRGENFVTRKITKWIGNYVNWRISEEDKCEYSDPDYILSLSKDKLTLEKFPKLRLGNLDSYRDWGYSPNFCEAMYKMLQQDKPDDYVICTGETHSVREFLDTAFSYVGINDWSNLVVIDPKFYRPAEVDYLRGSNEKAKRVLHWHPQCSLTDLVKIMVDNDKNEAL